MIIKAILRHIITIVFLFSSVDVFASPQMPDYIIIKGDTVATYNLLVEQYLQKHEQVKSEKLFGLSFRDGSSLNCWRGYQAVYKVENDSLFVADLIDCGSLRSKRSDRSESLKKMAAVFGNKLISGHVFIDWFTGDLNFPLAPKKILRWDGVFNTIYEEETVLHISSGSISGIENVSNYVDAPKAINRRYNAKIADLLFKNLKKVKWKNTDDCDCSEKYLITIGENGKILQVTMRDYRTSEEIDKNWDKEDYDYCINTIYRALKSLQFDVIKDKGKPISEDIYLELWFNDKGKLENWTH